MKYTIEEGVRFDGNNVDVNDPLVCPHCGGSSLHHGRTTVHTRKREDQPSSGVAVDGLNVTFMPSESDNPSYRRDGITIDLTCEGCASELTFALFQHKGSTYVKWHRIVGKDGA